MQPRRRRDRQPGVRRDRGSGTTERDEQFHDFVVSRRPRLLHTATLLTAGDTHLAEDLVQATLTKLYVAWPAFQRADNPDGYVRRVLVNALIDEKRRMWRRCANCRPGCARPSCSATSTTSMWPPPPTR
jgi:DNA-directed RNA polymerase specialized sigma24 family protein